MLIILHSICVSWHITHLYNNYWLLVVTILSPGRIETIETVAWICYDLLIIYCHMIGYPISVRLHPAKHITICPAIYNSFARYLERNSPRKNVGDIGGGQCLAMWHRHHFYVDSVNRKMLWTSSTTWQCTWRNIAIRLAETSQCLIVEGMQRSKWVSWRQIIQRVSWEQAKNLTATVLWINFRKRKFRTR